MGYNGYLIDDRGYERELHGFGVDMEVGQAEIEAEDKAESRGAGARLGKV